MENERSLHDEYARSIGLLKSLVAGKEYDSIGFFATIFNKDNYKRLFTRDMFWILMASVLSGNEDLLSGCRDSIKTLMKMQRNDGALPSNISPSGEVSYGVVNSRVDPTTLYILGCVRFMRRYPGEKRTDECQRSIKEAMSYLENNWENKEYGLLYVPRAGNWADEYFQQGFVLYDEVLWYHCLKEYAFLLKHIGDPASEHYEAKASGVKDMINRKFWVKSLNPFKEDTYGRLLHKFNFDRVGYYIDFYFSPDVKRSSFDYPCGVFDAFGNILAVLSGIPGDERTSGIISFIDKISLNRYPLIPAHYPFFPEETFRASKLYQYRFKEYVGHFHNGGLWAWYTGLYVAAMVKCGRKDIALRFLKGILRANREKRRDMDYFEYHSEKRAVVHAEIIYDKGIDFKISKIIADRLKRSRSMVLLHYKDEKVEAEYSLMVRSLMVNKGDMVKITAVGPDAENTLRSLVGLSGGGEKGIFNPQDVVFKESKPGGVPFLGVSAAAYVIAYKAFFENKIIFEEGC